jgi:cell wall assembly regulator SMI1
MNREQGTAMSDDVRAAWARLMGEAQRVAPRSAAAVRPPGPWAEPAGLPVPLSEDLRTWFRLHDGCGQHFDGEILPFSWPLSLSEAVKNTLMIREIWQTSDFGQESLAEAGEVAGISEGVWLDHYVLISADGSGGGLLVDQRPGPLHGCVQWWDKVDADHAADIVAGSVAELCDAVASALTTGAEVGGWVPVPGDGLLEWEVG